jgi:hypothetical protein
MPLRVGQVVETPAHTGARIESASVGAVTIEPDSQLKLMPSAPGKERLALDHGTIHALIWAPPARFIVETPSATTVDLGCEYTLHTSKDGGGWLTVEMGWVAFQWRNLESFIPAGAACRTTRAKGPGVPYFTDASPGFKSSIDAFNQTRSKSALQDALSDARPRDALSLWHLLQRTSGGDRAAVFARFQELVHLPPAVTAAAIMRNDPQALDQSWDALGLGDTGWWRTWKREWR